MQAMITWVSDAEVDGDRIDALHEQDPLFSAAVVVEPFPDSTSKDVMADVHRELCIGSAESRTHCARGRALWPLVKSRIRTLVIVGADTLAACAASDVTHLHDVHRLARVILIGRTDSDAYERCIGNGARPGSPKLIADLVSGYREPLVAMSALTASYRQLDPDLIDQITLLAQWLDPTFDVFPGKQIRLAALAAGLQLLERPRSRAGLMVRLHALDMALHARGHRLRPDALPKAIENCEARIQLDLWLPEAIDPTPPRDSMIVLDAALDRALPAGPETLARWLYGFARPSTRATYGRVVGQLLQWRARHGIDAYDHSPEDLEDWAFDRLRSGDAPRSAVSRCAAARRYHLYLLTGRHEAEIKRQRTAFMRDRRPLSFPDELTALIEATPTRTRTGPAFDHGLGITSRTPLESPQARQLVSLFGGDLAAAWERIETLRVSQGQWHTIMPLLCRGDGRPNARRTLGSLNAIMLVLATEVRWQAVPPELGYGCGRAAYRRLRTWVRDGTWAAVRSHLEAIDAYRDVRWEPAADRRGLAWGGWCVDGRSVKLHRESGRWRT